jgi:hypothetical protein
VQGCIEISDTFPEWKSTVLLVKNASNRFQYWNV